MLKPSSVETTLTTKGLEKQFVSPTHQRSIQLEIDAKAALSSGNKENSDRFGEMANTLAKSMGDSGRYPNNPFSEKENPALHQQFTKAADLRMQREMDIVAKDADIGHGM